MTQLRRGWLIRCRAHPGIALEKSVILCGGVAARALVAGTQQLERIRKIDVLMNPNLTRVAVLREPSIAPGIGQFAAIQAMASSSGVELSAIDPTDTDGIELFVKRLGQLG